MKITQLSTKEVQYIFKDMIFRLKLICLLINKVYEFYNKKLYNIKIQHFYYQTQILHSHIQITLEVAFTLKMYLMSI